MKVMVFNCGSSSLKVELIEIDDDGGDRRRLARATFQEIGRRTQALMQAADGRKFDHAVAVADHAGAATQAIEWFDAGERDFKIDAVAHRIVHGGERVSGPVVADDAVMRALEKASRFAPLHNPPAITTIRAVQAKFPEVPSVVVADTGFHRTLPAYARNYAIPRALAERHGIRRFGFHGVGHSWMLERYAAIAGCAPDALNLVTLQLGAGCSAAAIRAGKSIDTSMGLTPLEGLMMATRSGDLDPAVISFVAEREKISAAEVERILIHDSGLSGVSGLSGDMRELEAAAPFNPQAALAIEMFCYRVRKYIGAYAAVLGRVDAVIFSAGIGENSAAARARICGGLEGLGIEFDEERNRAASGREARFSVDGSRTALWVVPLDEELQIALAAVRLLRAAGAND